MLHKSLRVHEPHPVYPSPPRDLTFFFLFSCFPLLFFSSSLSFDSHPHPHSLLFLILFYPHILPLYLSCPGGLRCIVAVGFLSLTPYRVLSIHLLVLSINLLGPSPCHTA